MAIERKIKLPGETPGSLVEKDIKDVVGENGIWLVDNKLPIISYKGCKRLFDEAKLSYTDEPKLVCVPTDDNKQQHIWLMGIKDLNGKVVYSDGEASKYNTGEIYKNKEGKMAYSETKIDAKYRSRMAYKRAFCRCVMDVMGLEDFYSEDDAKEFKNPMKGQDIDSQAIESL